MYILTLFELALKRVLFKHLDVVLQWKYDLRSANECRNPGQQMTQGAKNLKQLQNVSSELLQFPVLLAATVGQVACSARRCGVAR